MDLIRYVCLCFEMTDHGQLRLQSVSKDGRRFRGAAAAARLVEIKELKIDRYSGEFKDRNMAVLRGCLKIDNPRSTNLQLNMPFGLFYSIDFTVNIKC